MADRPARLARHDESSEDEGDEGEHAPGGGRHAEHRERQERFALFDFLRLVANNRDRAAFATTEQLVNHLRENGSISSDAVARAMLAVPRELFVPGPYVAEALVDRPIRLDDAGFNISAPHVQAAALEALRVEPGDRVLDVGCGCGIVAAYAAYLAGPEGHVVAVDVRPSAISLARTNLRRLQEQDPERSELFAPIELELHNVFVPLLRHRGRYDLVHVGAAAPESHVAALLDLLGPRGGRIVVPVSGQSELRLISKYPDGSVQQRALSQVSFSELEVPRDIEVVVALEMERAERARRVEVPPSTFASDLAALAAPGADLAAVAAEAAVAAMAAEAAAPPALAGPSASAVAEGRVDATTLTRGRPRSGGPTDQSSATPAPACRAAGGAEGGGGGGGGAAASEDGGEGGGGGAGLGQGGGASLCRGGGQRLHRRWSATRGSALDSATDMEEVDPSSMMDEDRPSGGEYDSAFDSGTLAAHGWPDSGPAPCAPAGAPAPAATGPSPAAAASPPAQGAAADAAGLVDWRSSGLRLGAPDCELVGPGWRLPAHKAVLHARCELLRAHAHSGMRDSHSVAYSVPEAVERVEAMQAFLHYAYRDCLPPGGVDAEAMLQLLHAGMYFGCPRLVRLCEGVLARELVAAGRAAPPHRPAPGADPREAAAAAAAAADEAAKADGLLLAAAESAAPLLALADEHGLEQLGTVAMQFLLDHFSVASACEGYRQLPRSLVDRVAAEAVRRHAGLLQQLQSLAARHEQRQ